MGSCFTSLGSQRLEYQTKSPSPITVASRWMRMWSYKSAPFARFAKSKYINLWYQMIAHLLMSQLIFILHFQLL